MILLLLVFAKNVRACRVNELNDNIDVYDTL